MKLEWRHYENANEIANVLCLIKRAVVNAHVEDLPSESELETLAQQAAEIRDLIARQLEPGAYGT